MLYRLVIPVLLVAMAGFIIKAVDDVKGYDIQYETYCFGPGLPPGPSVEALFVGSSRMYATIDPIFLEGTTADRIGTPITAARLVGVGPDHIAYNMLARKYLDHHDAPRYVIIEAMYSVRKTLEFYGALWDRDLIPYVSESTALVGPAGYYSDVTMTEPFNHPSAFFHRDHINVVEMLTSRYLTALYRFVESPRESLVAPDYQCKVRNQPADERRRLYEEKLERFHTETPRLVSDKTIYMSMWQQAIADEVARAPGAPQRDYENAAMRALIRVFREAGVEHVYLVVIPTLGDTVSRGEREALEHLYPQEKILFLDDLFAENPGLARMYADPFHFSHHARKIITRFYADELLKNDD